MKCPHCLVEIHDGWHKNLIYNMPDTRWFIHHQICPSCKKIMLRLSKQNTTAGVVTGQPESNLVYPKTYSRKMISDETLGNFASDYKEAYLVLADSPKASAALSRRCLQSLLREKAGVKPGNLSNEIQQVIDSKNLPSYLSDSIDAIRNIGNFAAHPNKSTNTGEIVDVEPGEADWTLEVLESLFDFYLVQPQKLQDKRDALNKKLKDSGKPDMK